MMFILVFPSQNSCLSYSLMMMKSSKWINRPTNWADYYSRTEMEMKMELIESRCSWEYCL